jgi:hypothetical protein
MDIDPQKKTWTNFIKLTTYSLIVVVIILALMAVFLI